MGKRRRKDKNHDVGDSMPGTIGDSKGTIHDGKNSPSHDPDDAEIPESSSDNSNHRKNKQSTQREATKTSTSDRSLVEPDKKSKKMKYAQKYGDSWPRDKQQQFLSAHDVSAKEMGWQLTE